jgi:NADPH-dependent 2,4-dienoyl-CoA reductase/sulfur reductase-like enzyme/nitrite reductase/ring-hydroxylating ferredoxin subunit
MNDPKMPPKTPDLTLGVAEAALAEGRPLLGDVQGQAVLLARHGKDIFAIDNTCTHYGGPLSDGLQEGGTVRCPWHHACFSLESGEALAAPALDPVGCWKVERRSGMVYVRERQPAIPKPPRRIPEALTTVAIVGGGAAGTAAAEMLRREGYARRIVMVSADASPPCDRPNLSKGYLAGTAPEEWLPLRQADFYAGHDIELRLSTSVTSIDVDGRALQLADGSRLAWDALLLATGAEPMRLDVPGAELAHVHYLRTEADSRAIVAAAAGARRVAVVGASFIGMEVAAALRARGIDVDVIAPESCPMERVLGAPVGRLLRRVHEEHGVRFHLGTTVAGIDQEGVTLAGGGERVSADLVVIGVGVRPNVALAEQAGLAVERGVLVDEYLQTSAPGIFAAGDIARWPDRLTGDRIRVEHWVVAERQGQTAARNMLGARERFASVPFFWTEQYDLAIAYVGHAERWDELRVDGDVEARDCKLTYLRNGGPLAVATIGRDVAGLRAELEFETLVAAR